MSYRRPRSEIYDFLRGSDIKGVKYKALDKRNYDPYSQKTYTMLLNIEDRDLKTVVLMNCVKQPEATMTNGSNDC